MVGKEKQYNLQTANYKVLNFVHAIAFVNIKLWKKKMTEN